MDDPEKAGTLFQHFETLLGEVWRKRYCVLRRGQLLCFRKAEDSYPCLTIDMNEVTLRESDEEPFSFRLDFPSASYWLKALDGLDSIVWQNRIRTHIVQSNAETKKKSFEDIFMQRATQSTEERQKKVLQARVVDDIVLRPPRERIGSQRSISADFTKPILHLHLTRPDSPQSDYRDGRADTFGASTAKELLSRPSFVKLEPPQEVDIAIPPNEVEIVLPPKWGYKPPGDRKSTVQAGARLQVPQAGTRTSAGENRIGTLFGKITPQKSHRSMHIGLSKDRSHLSLSNALVPYAAPTLIQQESLAEQIESPEHSGRIQTWDGSQTRWVWGQFSVARNWFKQLPDSEGIVRY